MKRKKKSTSIKVFWFDLGNVIMPFDFSPAFTKLARLAGTTPESFKYFFHTRPWLEAHTDTGKTTGRDIYDMLKRAFSLDQLSFEEFGSIWNDIFTENHEVSDFIRELKKRGYRLILISNTNALHWNHLYREYPVLKNFDYHILSFKEKMRKPDRAIYKLALQKSKARPHHVFYTDDRHDLIQAASSYFNISSHLFTHYKNFRHALKRLGIH